MAFIRNDDIWQLVTDSATILAFQSSDDQMDLGSVLAIENPRPAATDLKAAFTPRTTGYFPAPYIKKSELLLRSNR